MKLFKVSAYSRCGSYFQPYLQSVTVCARDKAHALEAVKDWLKQTDRNFEIPEKDWEVNELNEIKEGTVIDWYEDSDY